MISRDMKTYNYYAFGDSDNYGQIALIKDDTGEPIIQGTIKIAINTTSESIQDNINYKDSSYIGLTYDKSVSDAYVIQYGNEKLKVLYVNPKGRLIQVFMKEI